MQQAGNKIAAGSAGREERGRLGAMASERSSGVVWEVAGEMRRAYLRALFNSEPENSSERLVETGPPALSRAAPRARHARQTPQLLICCPHDAPNGLLARREHGSRCERRHAPPGGRGAAVHTPPQGSCRARLPGRGRGAGGRAARGIGVTRAVTRAATRAVACAVAARPRAAAGAPSGAALAATAAVAPTPTACTPPLCVLAAIARAAAAVA